MVQIYQEIASLGGRRLAGQLANLPILVELGELTRDEALRLLDDGLTSGPYVSDPIDVDDPEAVRARLADPDWKAWFALYSGPEPARQRVRSLVYDALVSGSLG
jgi:hypothetical protein